MNGMIVFIDEVSRFNDLYKLSCLYYGGTYQM